MGGGRIAAALIEGDAPQVLAVQAEIARTHPAVIPLQSASEADCAAGPAYRIDWLCEEISTSTNTTAAGGNASLMAIAL